MLRSIGSVAAGYLIFGGSAFLLFQLSGVDPHGPAPLRFKIASIVWGCVFALVAGWLTARIAPSRPVLHAGVLAGIIALMSASFLILPDRTDPYWTNVAALLLMAPSAWLGGLLSRRSID